MLSQEVQKERGQSQAMVEPWPRHERHQGKPAGANPRRRRCRERWELKGNLAARTNSYVTGINDHQSRFAPLGRAFW